jgi:hypothetical protein
VYLRFRAVRLPGAFCLDDLKGEVLQFGEKGAEFLRAVEPRLVFGKDADEILAKIERAKTLLFEDASRF